MSRPSRKCEESWSCAGVNLDFWSLLRKFESNLLGDIPEEDAEPRSHFPTHQELRRIARSPRIRGDGSIESMAHQWNAFSSGPLTKRLESVEDWQHLQQLQDHLSQQHTEWSHGHQTFLKRTPTFDENLQWFREHYVDMKQRV